MHVLALPFVTASLLNGYVLVGTIACEGCAVPFQPVGVVRQASGKLMHLRPGDQLVLNGGRAAAVSTIGSGFIVFRTASGQLEKLTSGGFPDEAPPEPEARGALIAHRPKGFGPMRGGSLFLPPP